MIELHNNLSPDQKIYVDPKTIIAIEPWNSGAAIITLSTGLHIAVSETVEGGKHDYIFESREATPA